jgi:GxxExxY protein
MARELEKLGLRFDVEKTFPVTYDDMSIEFGYRVDLIVEDVVIVEIKAVENILPVHEAQLLSYLKLSGARVGLLINFNVAHLRHGVRRRIC